MAREITEEITDGDRTTPANNKILPIELQVAISSEKRFWAHACVYGQF